MLGANLHQVEKTGDWTSCDVIAFVQSVFWYNLLKVKLF
jgi:hypothetical protein